jgi:hypothetical protein
MMAGYQSLLLLAAIIVGIFAIRAVAAALVHPMRREMMALGEDILATPGLKKNERIAFELMLDASTSFYTGFAFAILPFFFIVDLIKGRVDTTGPRSAADYRLARFAWLMIVSVFAANPFVGLIWAPIHAAVMVVITLTHASGPAELLRLFIRGARIKHAAQY